MNERFQSIDELIELMTPEIHSNLKTAVELGRWANGERLSTAQTEYCLQAIIAYEQQHLPETQRTAYIDKTGLQQSHCASPEPEPKPITWRDSRSGREH
jgi:uncharacterized protein